MYVSDKSVLSGDWLNSLINKGYKVMPVLAELGDDTGKSPYCFHDGSIGWIVFDGRRKVGVSCHEVGQEAETLIHFSSIFIWFGGNFELAKEIENLLIGLGGRPK